MLLEHDTLSVEEYVSRFTALSRFAPFMVSSEKAMCEKFQMDLSHRIQTRVALLEIQDFKQLVSKAKICERDIEKSDGRRDNFKKACTEGSY